MTVVERSIVVNVPVDVATDYAIDPSIRTDWYVGMQTYNVGDGYPNAGTKSTWVMKTAGVTIEADEEVLSYQRNNHLQFRFDSKLIKGEMMWTYEDEGNSTTISVRVDYEMFGGILGKVANALVVEKALISDLDRSMEKFKLLVEKAAATSG